ncbi:MAG: hypothetical protein AAFV25_12215 [Bacteroidota bacterium]
MSNILETRRVFETVKATRWEFVWVKNPYYDAELARQYALNGQYYPEDEFVEKEVPRTVRRKRSHIEYRIKCAFCGGTNGWVRRKDASFCSANCRSLNRMAKKKGKAEEEKE